MGAGLIAAAMAVPAAAQDDDLRKDVEELKKGQQEILKLLKQIQTQQPAKPAARKGPEVKDVIFTLGDNPVVGSGNAQLTIIELTDYQ